MKKNNIMIAVILMSLCSETQTGGGGYDETNIPRGRNTFTNLGLTAAVLGGTAFLANYFTSPETERIRRRKLGLVCFLYK